MRGDEKMYEVLIAENDPMVAMIEKQYIAQNPSFNAAEICGNGKEALRFLENGKIDLLILDLSLPEMDGITLLKQIRSKDMPVSVIAVTAVKKSALIESALRLGVEGYLIKPFDNAGFQEALGRFCRRRDAFSLFHEMEQEQLDRLIMRKDFSQSKNLPKGIQKKTMERICRFLQNNPNDKFSGERIAEGVRLSRVTVRRYLNHLCDSGEIAQNVDYETGGRPCMLYYWNV